MRLRNFRRALLLTCLSSSCTNSPTRHDAQSPLVRATAAKPQSSGPKTPPPGLTPEQKQEFTKLSAALQEARSLQPDAMLSQHSVEHSHALGFEPLQSKFLDRIQQSSLGLSEVELPLLAKNGFVISAREGFPTFLTGYAAIYAAHLPVYISADAILEAVHRSYDSILTRVERVSLIETAETMLESMHARLEHSNFEPATRAAADEYLAVALSLLSGRPFAPRAGGSIKLIDQLVADAKAAKGVTKITLFGVPRDVDMSQFTPRGHYEGPSDMEQYFRAMIWLGRMDLRLIESMPNGSQVFHRSQFDGMLQLRALLDPAGVERWTRIDAALRAFVGESDSMVVPEVDRLLAALGGVEEARRTSDATLRAAIESGGFGTQRIASDLMANDGEVETLPLSHSFLLFGQRYVLDSHVLSQVVFDRVQTRLMPNPLDVAYAALANDAALPLLGPELARYKGYAGALEGARLLTDAHGAAFWDANLYNMWLGSLRALSPAPALSTPAASGLPKVATTEAWSRRILGTQLASWAELRHDTLLYAKQSYSGIPMCDYPDAYVEPYPEFFATLKRFAERGSQLAETLALGKNQGVLEVGAYFDKLGAAMATLEGMARNQRDGTVFSKEQLAFINKAVRVDQEGAGCVMTNVPNGWLADLYFEPDQSIELSPTIADVHTQPADGGGSIVGRVLHVATGYPRLMVVAADTCQGPRAYVGVSFAYHEQITRDFKRLTDSEWQAQLQSGKVADVPWLASVTSH